MEVVAFISRHAGRGARAMSRGEPWAPSFAEWIGIALGVALLVYAALRYAT